MLCLIADRNLNGGQERQNKKRRRRRDRAKVRKRGTGGWMGTSRLGNLFVKNAPLIPEGVLKKICPNCQNSDEQRQGKGMRRT